MNDLLPLSPVFEQISSFKAGRVEFSVRLTGENRFYELEMLPMLDNYGRKVGRLATLRDITERRKMQEQLMAQDRLSSIGQLVSGIAHEINR